jgi:hypothetical protein
MSKRKRGHRGKKPGKNARDAKRRLQNADEQDPTGEQGPAGEQAAYALEQEQDQPPAEAQVAHALVAKQGKPPFEAQAAHALVVENSQTQVEAQAAHALAANLDMVEASEAPLEQATFEGQEVLPSIERTFDELFNDDQSAEDSKPSIRPATPMQIDIDEVYGEESGEDREMSWSLSPNSHWRTPVPPYSPQVQAGVLTPVQPYGDYCLVLCRLSSAGQAPDPSGSKTAAQRAKLYIQRREAEGFTLAERLASNCPTPVQFSDVQSYCGVRRSGDTTDWSKKSTSASAFVNDIRAKIRLARNQKLTILFRSIDGLTTNHKAFKSFLRFVKSCNIDAQLIFQWVKVCDSIRPTVLRNFRGIGGTADFMAADFLAHMEGTRELPEVQRILDILDDVEDFKGLQQGIQDRNALPRADMEKAEEVTAVSNSAGRKKAKA